MEAAELAASSGDGGHESAGSGFGIPGAGPHEAQTLQYCDFEDFVRHLDIDPTSDPNDIVMVAARQMFHAALPPYWSEQIDDGSSRVYFFNRVTGESLWMHPQEELFKQLIEEVRLWQPDQALEAVWARSEAHLRQAWGRAVQAIEQWSAYSVPQGPEEAPELGRATHFYFNASTGESRWVDPREAAEFDLRQSQTVLCECVSAHSQALSRMASSDSSDGDFRNGGGAQALVRSLWESLGPLPLLPLPARPADLPPPGESPVQGGRRPSSGISAGDDTVRSTMSYMSARSTASCGEEARDAVHGSDPLLRPEPQ